MSRGDVSILMWLGALVILALIGYLGYMEFIALPPINVVPTLPPFDELRWVNPYYSIGLEGARELRIQYLDPVDLDAYSRADRISGRQLWEFLDAMNVSVLVEPYRGECPDHVRMTFIRADRSRFMLRACLDKVVILRGVPGAVNEELPMTTRFSEILGAHLPEDWRGLLIIP